MNDDIIQDLKQFITAAVNQQTSDLGSRLDTVDERLRTIDSGIDTVNARLQSTESKIDDLSTAVADALEEVNESTSTQLHGFDLRIRKLEKKAA